MKDDLITFVSRQIAVDIFQLGDEPGSLTRRISFKGNDEKDQGGLDDRALTDFIEKSLRKHLSCAIADR